MIDIKNALLNGEVEGIPNKPERFVETVMSDVYIYPTTVFKIYKNRSGLFVDMTDPDMRKNFYEEDFCWNQTVSGEIHIGLHGISKISNNYKLTEHSKSDVWVIEMKRIIDTDTLFQRLLNNTVTEKNVRDLVHTQTKSLKKLTQLHLDKYLDLVDYSIQKLWFDRLDKDLRQFGKSFGKTIPESITDNRIDTLLDFFKQNQFLQSLSSKNISILIDNHAGNVVFIDDTPHFIDIFLPKRSWRVLDHHNNIARIATCVRVLGNDTLANAMYDTYSEYYDLAPRAVYDFEEAYNALIKGYYYTYLEKSEIAEKYFTFADSVIKKRCNFIKIRSVF